MGDVEDADVHASEIDENGAVQPKEGETKTDNTGRYTLRTEANANVVVVTASKVGFESKAIVAKANSASAVTAAEMNAETKAEADVYVEAKKQDSSSEPVNAADVVMHVDAELAADIHANTTSKAQVASAIRAAVESEHRYLVSAGAATQSQFNSSKTFKSNALIQYQASLATGGNASVSEDVFVEAMSKSNLDAGISASANAEARQTASLTIAHLSSGMSARARLALRKKAALLAAVSTSAAAEAEFRAESSMSAQANAVANAGVSLRTAIKNATTDAQIGAAWSSFESSVVANISTSLALGSVLSATLNTAIQQEKASFRTSVDNTSSVDGFVTARANFKTTMESRIKSSLSASSEANVAAKVVALVAVH